jgi:hypothetical protein
LRQTVHLRPRLDSDLKNWNERIIADTRLRRNLYRRAAAFIESHSTRSRPEQVALVAAVSFGQASRPIVHVFLPEW